MAALSDSDRRATWAELMQEWSSLRDPVAITKIDLRAAIDAIDAWVDANAASFNSAIPQPARGGLTSAQKAKLPLFVVRKRFERGA